MINNVSFNGYSRIDLAHTSENKQERLYNILKDPEIKKGIQELPEDMEVMVGAKVVGQKADDIFHKAVLEATVTLSQNGKVISKVYSEPEATSNEDPLKGVISKCVKQFKEMCNVNDYSHQRKESIPEMLKKNNGIVV